MTQTLSQRLPSLQALLALEAAERHKSFTRAAQELCVTQSAVSHRIRGLEEELGVPLFVRSNNGVLPTSQGHTLARTARRVLGELATLTDHMRGQDTSTSRSVSLGVPPSLAERWLIPRLPDFKRQHPDLNLQPLVDIRLQDPALRSGQLHAAIRYGMGHYPGLHVELLGRSTLVAVCTPALRPTSQEIAAALMAQTLVHADAPSSPRTESPWVRWLRAAGADGVLVGQLTPRFLTFNRQTLAITAALQGQGVAVVPLALAMDSLQQGLLVQFLPFSAEDEMDFYFVCRLGAVDEAHLATVRRWLAAQMSQALDMNLAHVQ